MDNNYNTIIKNEEEIYVYDEEYHQDLLKKRPWVAEY